MIESTKRDGERMGEIENREWGREQRESRDSEREGESEQRERDREGERTERVRGSKRKSERIKK